VTDNLPCVTTGGRYFRRLIRTASETLRSGPPTRHARGALAARSPTWATPRAITERNHRARAKASRVKQIR